MCNYARFNLSYVLKVPANIYFFYVIVISYGCSFMTLMFRRNIINFVFQSYKIFSLHIVTYIFNGNALSYIIMCSYALFNLSYLIC